VLCVHLVTESLEHLVTQSCQSVSRRSCSFTFCFRKKSSCARSSRFSKQICTNMHKYAQICTFTWHASIWVHKLSRVFSCGCSYAERTLWCWDSKHRALGNYFSVRIYYELLISKCCSNFFSSFLFFYSIERWQHPIFSAGETRFFSEVAFTQRFFFRKYPKSAQT